MEQMSASSAQKDKTYKVYTDSRHVAFRKGIVLRARQEQSCQAIPQICGTGATHRKSKE
jgi:hypothetical protein